MNLPAFLRVLCASVVISISMPTHADDLQTVRDRFVEAVCPSDQENKEAFRRAALDLAGTETAGGTWPDIDYSDQARSAWKTSKHLNNLLLMAKMNHSLHSDSLKERVL